MNRISLLGNLLLALIGLGLSTLSFFLVSLAALLTAGGSGSISGSSLANGVGSYVQNSSPIFSDTYSENAQLWALSAFIPIPAVLLALVLFIAGIVLQVPALSRGKNMQRSNRTVIWVFSALGIGLYLLAVPYDQTAPRLYVLVLVIELVTSLPFFFYLNRVLYGKKAARVSKSKKDVAVTPLEAETDDGTSVSASS